MTMDATIRQHAIEVEHKGMAIRGMVYRPTGDGRSPTALFLHGFTGQRIEASFLFVRLARALAAQGVAVVTFDFLHSGESDGSFEQMLVTGELADALRMTQWLAGQPFVDRTRMGLLGFSLGGLLAACAVGRVQDFRALALLAPTTVANLCRRANETPTVPGQPPTPVVVGAHTLHPRFFEDVRTLDPLADVVRHPRPHATGPVRSTLLVQGTADTAVTPAVSQEYLDALRRADMACDTHIIPDADHGFGKPAHQQSVVRHVSDWLARKLKE